MVMKLSEHSRAILYLLMSVACLIWLVQSGSEAAKAGTFFTWPNLVFVLCLLIVTGYGIFAGVQSWRNADEGNGDDDEQSREDRDEQ